MAGEAFVVTCAGCGAKNRKSLGRVGESPVCGRCGRALPRGGGPVALDERTFGEVVARSPVPVLVDFWAEWCGPCRAFAPVLERYAASHEDEVLVAKVDTEGNPGLASRFDVRAIPTVALFRGGREVARQAGALPPAALDSFVRTAR